MIRKGQQSPHYWNERGEPWGTVGASPANNASRDGPDRSRFTMLRAKSIPAFLEQANTDGMRATMLLQADGALQGSAGEGIDEIREQIMGVVSTAMWGEFSGAGGPGDLQMVLMGLEQGTLGVAKLCTGHLVCVYADQWVHMATIREKLLSLRTALESSLRGLA